MKDKLKVALKAALVAFFGALGGGAFAPQLIQEILKYFPLGF